MVCWGDMDKSQLDTSLKISIPISFTLFLTSKAGRYFNTNKVSMETNIYWYCRRHKLIPDEDITENIRYAMLIYFCLIHTNTFYDEQCCEEYVLKECKDVVLVFYVSYRN